MQDKLASDVATDLEPYRAATGNGYVLPGEVLIVSANKTV
jgi:hypothetical protein